MNNTSFEPERLRILQMVEEGKLNASEAAALLSSLGKAPQAPAEPVESAAAAPEAPKAWAEAGTPVEPAAPVKPAVTGNGPRWFRVRVTDMASGKTKVTVNLPIGLVNWGMKIGARYAPEVSEFDFNEFSQILQSGAEGKIVDVLDEEDGEHVEIFVD
jgi:hypothetical protein